MRSPVGASQINISILNVLFEQIFSVFETSKKRTFWLVTSFKYHLFIKSNKTLKDTGEFSDQLF